MLTREADKTRIAAPLTREDVLALRVGDRVLIEGVVFSARDAAHKRMVEALDRGRDLPFDPVGQIIYYMGPSPAAPGSVIGAAGPTTSGRMDSYAPALYAAGIRATMGKGRRSQAVRDAMSEHGGVYLAAIGGAGALLSRCIREAEIIAYPELGPEAVRRLVVDDFPAVVANDAYGADIYELARAGK
jgi:fumarate hydratase subunit beta